MKKNNEPRGLYGPVCAVLALALPPVFFLLVRGNRGLMTVWTDRVMVPFKQWLAGLCAAVPFSVSEWVVIAFGLFCIFFVIKSVILVAVRRKKRLLTLGRRLCGALAVALAVLGLMNWLWGANYYALGFSERSGIAAAKVSPEQLTETTLYFIEQVNRSASSVERDSDGIFACPRGEILAASALCFDQLESQYPFLAGPDLPVKPVFFSRFMSRCETTGVTLPFTGECSVNIDSPALLLPVTCAHEIAHQRGVASEQEANLVGILASVSCGRADYEYSGWLLGYIHLSNALYSLSPDLWAEARASLGEAASADLAYNSAYWRQFEDTALSEGSDKLYDSFLKGYGQQLGTRSYGAVVDLLVAIYCPDF